MSCSICRKNISKLFKCDLCESILCSSQCLLSHFSHNHTETQRATASTTSSNLFLQKISKHSSNHSPYITDGNYLQAPPSLDPKFNSNFTQVSHNNKQIILGAGTFGQVFLAKNTQDNKVYAIKHMNKQRLLSSLNTLSPIYTEIDIHSRLIHPNIIKLYSVIETKTYFEMIMEYANCGTLFSYIKRHRGLSEAQAFKFFIQVCNAIHFLHSNNLIHRDLKPENILMFDDERVKLCDFGWCVELSTKNRSTYCGTFEYMAPEIVNQHNYDKSIDIWSLGILLYELIHGFSPFRAVNHKNSSNEVIGNIKKHNLVFYKNLTNECKELITEMLCEDVEKRIKIEGIFESKFVKKYEAEGYCLSLINKENALMNKDKKFTNEINTIEDENLIPNRYKLRSKSGVIGCQMSNKEKETFFNNVNNENVYEQTLKNDDIEVFKKKIQKQKIINFQRAKSCLIQLETPQNRVSNKSNKNIFRNRTNGIPVTPFKSSHQMNFEDFKQNGQLKKNKSIADLIIGMDDNQKSKSNKNIIVKKFEIKHKHSCSVLPSKQLNPTIDTSEEQKTKDDEDLEGSIIPPNFISKISKPSYEVTQRSLFSAVQIVDRANNENKKQKGFWDNLLCGATENSGKKEYL